MTLFTVMIKLANNLSGGMGLTGGIADVASLIDCLVGIHKGCADDSILNEYDRVRRDNYHNIIDPISTENLRRLTSQDPDTAFENDDCFKLCLAGEKDGDMSRNMQLVSILHGPFESSVDLVQ